MKGILIYICLLISVFAGAQQAEVLTLKEAINYALEHKAEAEKARLEIQKSEYKIREVRANALPNISANGQLKYNPQLQKTLLPGQIVGQPPGTFIETSLGQPWNAVANVTLSQVIFNQSVFTGLKAAKSTREFYLINQTLTEEQIAEKVAEAYYQVYKTKEQLKNIESNLALTQKTVNVIQGLFDAGLAKEIDLDRTQVALNNLESNKQQLVNAVELSKNALKFMMGMPMEQEIVLPEDTFDERLIPLYEEKTFENRTEIALKEKQIELLNWQKKATISEYYPSLALVAGYNYIGQGEDFPIFAGTHKAFWSSASDIGLRLSIPIFSGFSIDSRVKQNQIDILEAEAELKETRLALNMQYKNALTQIKNSLITIDNQKENVALAEKVLRNTQNNYQYGLATLTDLLDAERGLSNAKDNLTNAQLAYKQAEIQVLKSQGNLKSLYIP